jgi:2'-5' RNA ligase
VSGEAAPDTLSTHVLSPTQPPRRDIGVALGLPEPFTSELQGWRERLGDPAARAIAPHVTLLPPTPVDAECLATAEEHLRQVADRHAPFRLRLSGSATFRPVSPVVFVEVVAGAEACAGLAADVRSGPLRYESPFPYHPHVTVAHHLPDPALDAAEAALASYDAVFGVWGFTLFGRGTDGVWRPQRDYPFRGDVGPVRPG